MLQRFKKLQGFEDGLVDRLQDNIATVLDPISAISLLNGEAIRGVKLLAGNNNVVPHKLNRQYIGYLISKQNANSVIWVNESVQNSPDRTIVLNCSADVTVDFWFY